MASSSLTGNVTSLTSGPAISDFEIVKFFKVSIHYPKAPNIVEVIWSPPLQGWIKCNTDDTFVGNPGIAACAGIFRNNLGANLGCFAHYIGLANALYAEIMGIILAIECAVDRNWRQLWIKSDSKLAVSAFKKSSIIPWQLKNRWLNCMCKIKNIQVIVSHVYREGNYVADMLANLGLTVTDFTWWHTAPPSISDDLAKNRDGRPYYRFC
ncbi:hypothetical protein QL285_053601 [Trifolium repens]|nr:hypothetical protein QL285_053601 [Trifolium repens]